MFWKYVLFKKGTLIKRVGVRTPWTPPSAVCSLTAMLKWDYTNGKFAVCHRCFLLTLWVNEILHKNDHERIFTRDSRYCYARISYMVILSVGPTSNRFKDLPYEYIMVIRVFSLPLTVFLKIFNKLVDIDCATHLKHVAVVLCEIWMSNNYRAL